MTAAAVRARAVLRPFETRVVHTRRLSRSFLRVTLGGLELADFDYGGYDQRIKLVLPLPVAGFAAVPREGDWFEAWRALPDPLRNPIRTYTVRAWREEPGELDLDFVLHDGGPASEWATTVRVGSPAVVIGPDRRAQLPPVGVEWRPGEARRVLVAGDETAVPAACAILEALPASARGVALLEVPHPDDVQPVDLPSGVELHWLARDGGQHGALLSAAVRLWGNSRSRTAGPRERTGPGQDVAPVELPEVDIDSEILWDVPADDAHARTYVWLAGEAGVVRDLRRFLVRDVGLERSQVAFMGYWRKGRTEY